MMMTANKFSLFLQFTPEEAEDGICLCHEILPDSNDIYLLNEHLNRMPPTLDSASIIVLKRALQFKDNYWQIRFVLTNDVRFNDHILQKGDVFMISEGAKITLYDQSLFVHFKNTPLNVSSIPEEASAPPIVFEEPLKPMVVEKVKSAETTETKESISTTDHTKSVVTYDNLPEFDQEGLDQIKFNQEEDLFAIVSNNISAENTHTTRSFVNEHEKDVLKGLENEFYDALLDPESLSNKTIDHTYFKVNKLAENENFFKQGQKLAEQSTEDLIDGKLNVNEIETMLGSDFNDELFKLIKNDDILSLYAPSNHKHARKKQIPATTKKDYYAVNLNSPLREINFYTKAIDAKKTTEENE